ncbi:MAG TPA: hypothetical protein VGJ21_06585 [Terracidiphilus sp.]|jgi:hypothetical protein
MLGGADSENPAKLVYSVLELGAVGAWLVRLEPRGLARTLFAMAATLTGTALPTPNAAAPISACSPADATATAASAQA